jgi:hypothetical protein
VLQLAAATLPKERAAGFDAVGRWFDDTAGDSLDVIGVFALDLGFDKFAGGGEGYEHDTSIFTAGETSATEDERLDPDSYEGRFDWFFVALATS